jgi:hypothetical protein
MRPRAKQCSLLRKRQIGFCYECPDIPCEKLRRLDERYRNHYRMSMIENLEYIRDNGMEMFLKKEEGKWRCPDCGSTVCCHNGICYNCSTDELKNRKNINRWKQ